MHDEINKLESLKRKPLNVMVYEELLKSIIDGKLAQGTKLSEVHVAKQLNVSATPVREAFKKLASEGFIEIKPYCGAVVKNIDYEEIMEAYVVRESLEVLSIKLAISNISSETLNYLYKLINQYATVKTIEEYVNISNEFHLLIRKASNNRILENTLEDIEKIILRDRNISASNMERINEIYKEHKAILDAIKEEDIEEAEKAVRFHIKSGFNYIKDRVSKKY
ncbi:GntR family transcriptional regulator [Abyssisolibacter fermentans]|uniref:GntR family transcriptional regulator n=1 Tax=Abyssisolibacter fermentans TaxID=1766203 RepID=UPI000830DD55|nr:GntR family transcriptional regulator [Abyssisolibacter fermentans]